MSHLTVLCPEASTCPHPQLCTRNGCQRRLVDEDDRPCPTCDLGLPMACSCKETE